MLVQKQCEIEIAGGLSMACQQRRGFAAVLCSVIDHMQETMPEDAVTLDAAIGCVTQMTFHILIFEAGDISPHRLFFFEPARIDCGEGWEFSFLQLCAETVVFGTNPANRIPHR